MKGGLEERALAIQEGLIHYLHRVWDDNGETLCGVFLWFSAQHKSTDRLAGKKLAEMDPRKTTCMECIILQVPR